MEEFNQKKRKGYIDVLIKGKEHTFAVYKKTFF